MNSKGKLKFIPLGGIGDVTKNMYVYEYTPEKGEGEILIVDCGVGFPDSNMYGVDLVIPDCSYLQDKKNKIKGIVLTHGHEDHIAALPYIWPKLKVPIFATPLTCALAKVRLEEAGVRAPVISWDRNKRLRLGNFFNVEFVHVTHSVPDSNHLIIRTPKGTFYHGSDFKFDWTPVDGDRTEVGKIIAASQEEGILCLASDCLGAIQEGYTLSEKAIEGEFEKAIRDCRGKFIVTTQSSNISRIQQAINVAVKHGREICLLGRSVKQNVEVAQKLDYISLPRLRFILEKDIAKVSAKSIALIVAGSQGQINSALYRLASGDNKFVSIKPHDMVVFSADPIPGNEEAVHNLIDTLVDQGAEVSYSEVLETLHVSGHGASHDLMFLIALTSPKFIIPIGGTKRHMYHYRLLAKNMGYTDREVLLLENGQVTEFIDGFPYLSKQIEVKNIMVDGLGIGDVGNVVLRDRRKMAEDGIVVVIIPLERISRKIAGEVDIISRGFVYMKESASLIRETKEEIFKTLRRRKETDLNYTKKVVEDVVEKLLYRKTHRRPMVIVVLMGV